MRTGWGSSIAAWPFQVGESVNPFETWRRIQNVDKRTIEGQMASFFWRKLWLDAGKISLCVAFLTLVVLSVTGAMPTTLSGLGILLRSLYSPAEWTPAGVLFSGGLGGVSILTLGMNLWGFRGTIDLLNQSLKIAERHSMRKWVL